MTKELSPTGPAGPDDPTIEIQDHGLNPTEQAPESTDPKVEFATASFNNLNFNDAASNDEQEQIEKVIDTHIKQMQQKQYPLPACPCSHL